MRKSSKGWKQVTPKEFKMVKTLQAAGLNRKQISQVTGRGPQTIGYLMQEDTLKAYHATAAKRREKRLARGHTTEAGMQAAPALGAQGIELDAPGIPPVVINNDIVRALNAVTEALIRQTVAYEELSEKLDTMMGGKRPWSLNRR